MTDRRTDGIAVASTALAMRALQRAVTNEWVLNKAGIKMELLDTVKVRKLAYYGCTMRKQGNCLEKEIMQKNNAR